MMQPNQNLQLFQFSVPGLSEEHLAIWSIQVLDIVNLPDLVSVPDVHPSIQGISRWQNNIVPNLDLSSFLIGEANEHADLAWRQIIAQCVFDGKLIQVGIPILAGAKIVNILDGTDLPKLESEFKTTLVQATFEVDHQPIHLLNLNALHAIFVFDEALAQIENEP